MTIVTGEGGGFEIALGCDIVIASEQEIAGDIR